MPCCPFCDADLTRAIEAVPPEVTRKPFPLRCTTCKYLVKVWPYDAGLVVKPLPIEEVIEFVIQERRRDASRAG
jgi:hypothetical protein